MSTYIEKAENQTLPLVVLRGVVAFPGMTVNCDIPKDSFKSAAAAQSAASGGELVVLASLLDISEPDTGEPDITKLCPVGTVARIKQLIRTPTATPASSRRVSAALSSPPSSPWASSPWPTSSPRQ